MPSKSKSQQRLMGMAYAYKTGKLKAGELDPKYRDSIISLSKKMSEKDLEDFAKKVENDAPEKIEESMRLSGNTMYKHTGFKGPKFGSSKIEFFLDFDVEKHGPKIKANGPLMDYRDWLSK